MFKSIPSKILLTSFLLLAGTGTALADAFSWIYGMNTTEAKARLEADGFTFVRWGEPEGEARSAYWLRRSYCIRFFAVNDEVTDAIERPTSDCK